MMKMNLMVGVLQNISRVLTLNLEPSSLRYFAHQCQQIVFAVLEKAHPERV